MDSDNLLPLLDSITVINGGPYMGTRKMIVSPDIYEAITRPAVCPTCAAKVEVMPAHPKWIARSGAHGSTQPSMRPCDDPWHRVARGRREEHGRGVMRRGKVTYEVYFVRDFGGQVGRGWSLDTTWPSLREAKRHVRTSIAADVPTRIDRVTREQVVPDKRRRS